MKIVKLCIQNFMGIKQLINLDTGAINTFVGKNDAGKSIIIRALDVFFNEKKFDEKYIYKGIEQNERTSIQISFDVEDEIDSLALDSNGLLTIKRIWWSETGKIKTEDQYLVNDYTDVKFQDLWNRKEQELNDLIESLGIEPKKSGRGKKNVVRIEQIEEYLNTTPRIEIYHTLGDLIKNLENVYELTMPSYSVFDADQSIDVNSTPFQSQFKPLIGDFLDGQKEVTSRLQSGLETCLTSEFDLIGKYMSKNIPRLKKLAPTTQYDWKKAVTSFDLNLALEGELYDIPISCRGTGFRRLLMVAYFEYLANKNKIKNQIFAIEEPETYLHPSAQTDLLNSIIKLSENSQFFLTTHSPIFAGASRGENSILVKKDESGLSDYSQGENIVKEIINELGIKPDYYLLKSAKFLVFVEGPDDVCFLKEAARGLMNKNLGEDCIHIVIGGGSTLANYAELDLFQQLSGSNRYAVIVDQDNNDPTKQKCKDKIKQRCTADNGIFFELPKREIENYCSSEVIKQKAVDKIIQKEGPQSQNPVIARIRASVLNITADMDVEKYLSENGISNFKSSLNIETFMAMSSEDWKASDSGSELQSFFQSIYNAI